MVMNAVKCLRAYMDVPSVLALSGTAQERKTISIGFGVNMEDARMPFPTGDAHCPVLGGIDFDENHEIVRKEN
jgi:hypothetical protein